MAIIFNGKNLAKQKEIELTKEIRKLREKGTIPKLESILIGNDPASVLYVNLKKKAAERVGCKLDVRSWKSDVGKKKVIQEIKSLNRNAKVHGIMVQLPLPKDFSKKDRDEIIASIAKKKDVDGLRQDSYYLTPTVKAVLNVFKQATSQIKTQTSKVVVVGFRGFEGRKIYKVLKEMGYEVSGLDRDSKNFGKETKSSDILISVTGSFGIIGKDSIKDGAIVIDVGSPKGDVKTKEIIDKASFISPVPGGVGPVTISCLLENLVESASG